MKNRLLRGEINCGMLFLFVVLLLVWRFPFPGTHFSALGAKDFSSSYISSPVLAVTTSRFSEKIITNTTVIPFTTEYRDEPETEVGILVTKEEGKDGRREEDKRITYYDGAEYQQETVDVRIIPAVSKIILRGTKIIYRDLETTDGKIRYKGKIHAWATSYNENCPGCDEWTATGRHVNRGIVAVDPKVIPLHTRLYIPGYGFAQAEDVGGAIKGNKVDLYFEPWAIGQWSARWVDVYVVD